MPGGYGSADLTGRNQPSNEDRKDHDHRPMIGPWPEVPTTTPTSKTGDTRRVLPIPSNRTTRKGGRPRARQHRSYEGEDSVFHPLHYLALSERKIGALDQPAPLAGWELPDAVATVRRLMEARSGRAGSRECVHVLRLLETFGLDDLHGAVKHALRLGATGFDAVKHLVLCRVEKRPPRLDLDVYPYLPKANVAKTRAASYRCLTSAGAR